MEIIYPPLVEQGIKYYLETENEPTVDKGEFYRAMVDKKLITETGLPTQHAIDQGFIKDYYEKQDLSFDEFLSIYPFFQEYDSGLFKCIDGFWEIPVDLKAELIEMLETDQLEYDDAQQINIYLEDR
ncbi:MULTISPECIES: hypothetical protein [Enterococcus]|uniref:Uncharacterized protein n=1 Tax=Candidatus Enterococcus mangumiae TaxID=2230878 RepID=A0ABZ2T4R1_9ENTE|nr:MULTISPECIES: hypothetical protein [unclassified Enterococcus]MBO0491059.1 hypothetical protein [Enterococcus sp. DIV1094]MBO1299218.1 hypothetical protein [Enterococcus sp. DIV1271a]